MGMAYGGSLMRTSVRLKQGGADATAIAWERRQIGGSSCRLPSLPSRDACACLGRAADLTSEAHAHALDTRDPLAALRDRFNIQ